MFSFGKFSFDDFSTLKFLKVLINLISQIIYFSFNDIFYNFRTYMKIPVHHQMPHPDHVVPFSGRMRGYEFLCEHI